MAIRSGLAAQLGLAAETTFGVRNTPDHFYELVSESMKLDKTRTSAKGIRPAKLLDRAQRFRTTKVGVGGDLSLEVQSSKYGLLFKHCLGASTITADGAGWKHAYTLADNYGLSLTAQIGTPDSGGTVRVREYTGCKIDTWELQAAIDQVLSLKLTLDGANESTSQTLATPTWPSATQNEVYYVDEIVLTVGGTAVKCKGFTLTGKNAMKTDRYFIGSQTKSEQIRNAYASISGTIDAEFTDLTLYNLFVSDTTAQASAQLIITCTGQLNYDTAKPNKIVITAPAVRYNGTTPNVSGTDVIDIQLPFDVLDDDTNTPFEIDYYTADTTD